VAARQPLPPSKRSPETGATLKLGHASANPVSALSLHAQDFATKADQYSSGLVEQHTFMGSVLLARDEKPVFHKSCSNSSQRPSSSTTTRVTFCSGT
jgi:hypothetical protein